MRGAAFRAALAALAALAVAASRPASADRGAYVIESFDVELEIEPDAEIVVEERLVVEFSEPRHGIYRTIPVRYTDPRGYLYSLGFRLLEVVDENGRAHETQVSREGRYVKLRIGSADATVRGRVAYTIRYRVRDALVHFAEHDELYWNATGNEWQTGIESATARIRLPGAVAAEDVEAAAYTGAFGSREQEASVEQETSEGETRITYRAQRPLSALEGLTVAAAWPHGIVHFPGRLSRTATFMADNWIVLMPLAALAFLLQRYWTKGRDPLGAGSVMVRYEPPPDLTAGEIGALVDERVDLRDITASIVDLAVRGHLRIRIDEEDRLFGLIKDEGTWFEKVERSRDDLRAYEKEIFDGVFATGDVVSTKDLEERFYRKIPGIRDKLWEDLAARRFVEGKPTTVRTVWKLVGAGAGAGTIWIGYWWAAQRGAAFPSAMAFPILSGILVGLLFLLAARAMPRRTPKGVASRDWALGFEEFVDRVEREKLEADRERNVFESLLPYAMALGVAARWARQFEGIYQSSPPVWFQGPRPFSMGGFSTPSFERSLSSAMARAGTDMKTLPRSRGSSGFGGGGGGGGFSGGGGGGGGGGSW